MPNLDAVIAVSPNRMREGELTVAAADVRINAYSYPLSIVLSIDLGRQSSCDLIRSTSYDNRTPGLELARGVPVKREELGLSSEASFIALLAPAGVVRAEG